jgi:hypothetical protein
MAQQVFLVGSVPFENTEQVFRMCGELIGPVTKRLPDGERGGWLPGADFLKTRGFVPGRGASLLNPPITRTVRLADGITADQIAFEALHYYPNAMSSYGIFARLKEEGRLASHLRYQVSVPTAFTGSIHFDHDQVRALWPAYEKALFRDVRKIIDSIPHRELAISWDVVEFGISLANPDPLEVFSFDELARAVARAIDVAPADVECGLHFCYGGHNSNGMPREGLNHRDLNDTALMTRFFNATRQHATRPMNWLHLPVPRPHEDEQYFAPLRGLLRDPSTELYLGLLYPDDGIERTKRKMAAARKFVKDFGVGAACGLNPFVSGLPAERLVETLAYHRTIAELE